ncbi:hypothetical protein ACT17_15460 [Mycolicibacterium conceptionense]|uniref:Uncharacterized protein n=1 Tax=Mycolicibacterium conceptionense TaxID=451644 RepID=A0A0J8WXB9_9MYCO|nr:hypothetical protein [Mycolicibacterium conceptionense]KMV17664.1 hypothetical protein ACT17_15460 [Mycolicibacterium conceptionense]
MALTYALYVDKISVYRGGTFDGIFALAADAALRSRDNGGSPNRDRIVSAYNRGDRSVDMGSLVTVELTEK